MTIAEIEDVETGCTYIKNGKDLEDCIKQFQFMFFDTRKYTILWTREVK